MHDSGLGEPSYFYLFVVFSLNGAMIMLFFFLCYHLRYVTMAIICCIIALWSHIVIVLWLQYLALYSSFIITQRLVLFSHNFSLLVHLKATRVQWTPPLRESFAFPFLILQLLVLSVILRWVSDCSLTLSYYITTKPSAIISIISLKLITQYSLFYVTMAICTVCFAYTSRITWLQ